MPFIIDGQFSTTNKSGCTYYILEKVGRLDLMGRTLDDVIQMHSIKHKRDLHNALLALQAKSSTVADQMKIKQIWQEKIKPIFQQLEKDSKPNDWFCGHITMMDFGVYELTNQLSVNFPDEIKEFPKLRAIWERVYNIPEIKEY